MECKETAQAFLPKTASANLSAVNKGIKSIEIFLNVIEKQIQLLLR